MKEIGSGIFDGDSPENQKKTVEEKEKALNLSKTTYNQILKLQSQKINDYNSVYKQSNSEILKKLTKDHGQLLKVLEKEIKNYETKTNGGIVLNSSMNKKRDTKLELEQVQIQEEQKETFSETEKIEYEELKKDVQEITEIFQDMHSIVQDQHKQVDVVSENIEVSNENVQKGLEDVKKASIMGTLGGTVMGGVVGMSLGIIGGPIGMYAGLNIGLGVGIAVGTIGTGIGAVSGYFLGKKIQKVNGVDQPEASTLKK